MFFLLSRRLYFFLSDVQHFLDLGNHNTSLIPHFDHKDRFIFRHRLFMRALDPQSRLRRDGQAPSIDGFQDFVAAATQQGFANSVAQLFGMVKIAIARFAQQR